MSGAFLARPCNVHCAMCNVQCACNVPTMCPCNARRAMLAFIRPASLTHERAHKKCENTATLPRKPRFPYFLRLTQPRKATRARKNMSIHCESEQNTIFNARHPRISNKRGNERESVAKRTEEKRREPDDDRNNACASHRASFLILRHSRALLTDGH